MPVISVLLPIYNTDPAHLRDAIDSVLGQSFADFELIIVDDYPHDSAAASLVASYTDARIRFVRHSQNMGISATRNEMLDMAQGEFIAVMDHDDLCLPERFARQIAVMRANPEIGVCGTAYKRFGRAFKGQTIIYPQDDADIRAGLFFKNLIHHPSAMIRKSVLDAHNIRYDTRLVSVNDRRLYRDISEHAQLHNLPDVLCLYRLHAQMTSRTRRDDIVREQCIFRAEYLDKMNAHLDSHETDILNEYITKGRCKIKNKQTLQNIEHVLLKLCAANTLTEYLPAQSFNKICAQYFIKRCNNAMWHGRVASGNMLAKTELPVHDAHIPALLRLFNFIK